MSNHHLVTSRAATVLQTVALTLPALLIATQLVAEHFREQDLFVHVGIKRLLTISIGVSGSVLFLLIAALFSVISLLGGFDSELFLDLSLISLLLALLLGGLGVVLATLSALLTWKVSPRDLN